MLQVLGNQKIKSMFQLLLSHLRIFLRT